MANLGEVIGLALSGGDIDREGARLDGLNLGTQIQSRRASTKNALAQARLRVDEAEARESLADELDLGGNRAIAATIRAGANPDQAINAQLGQQEQEFRGLVADVTQPFETRQAAAQGIEGKVVDPFQIQNGLFADVFNPGAAPEVSATGASTIAANEALVRQRDASAALSDERRLHPDRFKATAKTSAPTGSLVDDLLPGGQGQSIVPDSLNAEDAFGAESFVKGAANAVGDFLGLGTIAPSEAQANAVLSELSARTQIVMRADVPGGRPPVIVQELLGRYAEDPRQLFRGDELAKQNLTTTVDSLKRSLSRIQDQMNSPGKKTPTRQQTLEESLFAYADLVADYEKVLQSLNNTATPAGQPDADGFQTTASGVRFRLKPGQ